MARIIGSCQLELPPSAQIASRRTQAIREAISNSRQVSKVIVPRPLLGLYPMYTGCCWKGMYPVSADSCSRV
jgi:hypothetical protein